MYKKLAIAFSVANLCFFKTWSELLHPPTFDYLYFCKDYPGYASLIALLINVLVLTAIFFAGFSLLWQSGNLIFKNLARASFLVIFLRALNGIRVHFAPLNTSHLRTVFGRTGFFALGMVLLGLLILAITRFGLERVTRKAAIAVLILFPFGLLGMTQGTWLAIKYGQRWHERPPAPLLQVNTRAQPRVLWLIFDEMSEELTFANRPPGVSLPNLDRLRTEALLATNAFAPAAHTTQSIPALLTGRMIAFVKPAGPDELMLKFPERPAAVGWTTQSDIFSEVRAAGFNTAVVGWYHPYCRVIGDRLTSCLWEPVGLPTEPSRISLIGRLLRQQADLLPLLPFTGRIREQIVRRTEGDYRIPHVAAYDSLVGAAARAAANPGLGLTFVHLPVPHPPYVYDRRTAVLDISSSHEYLDNLALADRALGELRQAMERGGTWEGTTILISSDHWWRTDYWQSVKLDHFWAQTDAGNLRERDDHRVPFLLRMAGQKSASTYDPPFNTVQTHDLILEIMKGKITNGEQVAPWLDSHRTIGESPYRDYNDPQ